MIVLAELAVEIEVFDPEPEVYVDPDDVAEFAWWLAGMLEEKQREFSSGTYRSGHATVSSVS